MSQVASNVAVNEFQAFVFDGNVGDTVFVAGDVVVKADENFKCKCVCCECVIVC